MSGRNKRGRDAMGVGLAALNRLASAGAIDKLRLRKPVERAVYEGAKAGFRSVGAANRTFAKVQGRGKAERPGKAGGRDLFDLTPTEEQQMIVGATREFSAEHDEVTPTLKLKRNVIISHFANEVADLYS